MRIYNIDIITYYEKVKLGQIYYTHFQIIFISYLSNFIESIEIYECTMFTYNKYILTELSLYIFFILT